MRSTGEMNSNHAGKCEITIEGTAAEVDALKRMIMGLCYVGNPTAEDKGRGRPKLTLDLYSQVEPMPDPELADIFPPLKDVPKVPEGEFNFEGWGKVPVKTEVRYYRPKFPPKCTLPDKEVYSPAVIVQHICGYGGKEQWKPRAEALHKVGFELMRGARGQDGRFWELWYLPFIPFDGALFGFKKDIRPTLENVIHWITTYICPGTVDVIHQHIGLGMD